MATLGEQSLLSVLHGGEPLPGVETELAAPLRAHPSANIPLAARAALDVMARRRGDQAELNLSAALWWEHLEPGVPGVLMRNEFGSTVYGPWIVCPIATAARVHAGNDAGRRAREWVRAWATLAVLATGWEEGLLISDQDDPPGRPAPGPVFATAQSDRQAGYTRRRRGILPSVFAGERSWQRSWQGDDDWRLARSYIDEPSASQLVQSLLGIPWRPHPGEDGDWVARYVAGVARTFPAEDPVLPLNSAEVALLASVFADRSAQSVARVLPWLDGWVPEHRYVLGCTDRGLWMLAESGGRTSTAPVYAATWEAGGAQGWLACDDGRRKSGGAPDAIVAGRGWEDGDLLRCERSDGLYGARDLRKPGGAELWRLQIGPDGYRLEVPAGETPPAPPPAPAPPPVRPRRRRCRLLRRLLGRG
jgi:hypothetical protein